MLRHHHYRFEHDRVVPEAAGTRSSPLYWYGHTDKLINKLDV